MVIGTSHFHNYSYLTNHFAGKQLLTFFFLAHRFWWEADGVFKQKQKDELLKGSLSRVICDNTDIQEVPSDPFRFGKFPSEYVTCGNIPSINLEAWREETNKGESKKKHDFFVSLHHFLH